MSSILLAFVTLSCVDPGVRKMAVSHLSWVLTDHGLCSWIPFSSKYITLHTNLILLGLFLSVLIAFRSVFLICISLMFQGPEMFTVAIHKLKYSTRLFLTVILRRLFFVLLSQRCACLFFVFLPLYQLFTKNMSFSYSPLWVYKGHCG